LSKSVLLKQIREQARKISEGEKARTRRDDLFLRARDDRDDVTLEELAEAAGVSVYAVKFALARRRKAMAAA
jgi:hypothetical protein